jgi:hypothetical protein
MYRVQVLGASYGCLLASKLLLAGHRVELVCTPAEGELIESDGFRIRIPLARQCESIEVCSRDIGGALSATAPQDADPSRADLTVLAIQEPQYRAPELRALLQRIAAARVPCLSIMNMPPPPFLARFPRINAAECSVCYADATAWNAMDPALVTHSSADPQAVRSPTGPTNELEVYLATNFRAAPFQDPSHNGILEALSRSIEDSRFRHQGREIGLPIKLRVADSPHVALSKWPMLITGNYRCLLESGGIRSIRDAVHSDLVRSRQIYQSVCEVLVALGSPFDSLVAFDKYAAAARSLTQPASAAKALTNGATAIERVDRLVQRVAQQQGMAFESLDAIVAMVDLRLHENRARAPA